jgi:hypothetical protein
MNCSVANDTRTPAETGWVMGRSTCATDGSVPETRALWDCIASRMRPHQVSQARAARNNVSRIRTSEAPFARIGY